MEKEISLKDLFDIIWKGKWIILISAIVAFTVSAAGAFYYDNTTSEVATIVTLQWRGATDGEYPDGTNFDYSTAIETYVISLAIDDLELDISTADVRDSISLTPIVPDDILAQIQAALKNGEELTYYATDYKFVLDNGKLGINVDQASDLINAIVNQFREDFERKYIYQMSVLDFSDVDYENYDYLDAYDILDAQVMAIESLMKSRSEVEFYSPTLGISFNDILVRTDIVTRIELNQIITRTNNYLLTKDEVYLITNYQYKIELAQLALDKATSKEIEIQDLVDNYKGSVQTVLIPGLELPEGVEFDIDTYYNTLVETLVGLQDDIAELTNDIIYFNLQIDRLNGEDGTFIITDEQQSEEEVKVVSNIDAASEKLEDIVNDSNILLNEYNEYLTSNIIKPLLAPEYQSSTNVPLVSLVGFVLGAALSTVVVFFKHDWK